MTFYNAIPGYTLLGYGAASRSGSVCPDNPTVGPGIDVGGGACQYAQPGGANATITCNPGTALNRDATSCEKGSGGFSITGKWMGVPIWGWALAALGIVAIVWMSRKPAMKANRRRRKLRPNRNPRKRRRAAQMSRLRKRAPKRDMFGQVTADRDLWVGAHRRKPDSIHTLRYSKGTSSSAKRRRAKRVADWKALLKRSYKKNAAVRRYPTGHSGTKKVYHHRAGWITKKQSAMLSAILRSGVPMGTALDVLDSRIEREKARKRRYKKNAAKQSTLNRMLAAWNRRSDDLSDDDWKKGHDALQRALGAGRVSRKTRRMNKARRAMRSVLVGHRYRANVSRKCDCGGGGDWKEGHAADCPRGIYNRSAAGKKAARGRKKVATLKKRADQLRRKYGIRARSGTRVKRP